MNLASAMICDSATVREGLLHVLGAGVTRIWREQYPAPLNVVVALIVELTSTELGKPHEFEVSVTGGPGVIANVIGGFQTERAADLDVGETQLLPMVIDVRGVGLPQPGRYRVAISIDGTQQATLSFNASLTADRSAMPRLAPPTGQRPN